MTFFDLCKDITFEEEDHDLPEKINKLMIQLKAKHKGFPVILFLDEIQGFGTGEGNNWRNLHPPGTSNFCQEPECAETMPGDCLNLILAINPGTSTRFQIDIRVSKKRVPVSPIDPILKGTIKYFPDMQEEIFLPEDGEHGFIYKEFFLRYRGTNQIQRLTRFIGHTMKNYLITSPEEKSVAGVVVDNPLWIDLGIWKLNKDKLIPFPVIKEALDIMLMKTSKIPSSETKLLFDGSLPKILVDFLFDFGKTKRIEVKDQKYFKGSECGAVIYYGSGHLEAFSRAKLQLCIITSVFFNPNVPEDLLEEITFDHETLAKLRLPISSQRGDMGIKYMPDDMISEWKWNKIYDHQTETMRSCVRYTYALTKASEKGMIIKIEMDSSVKTKWSPKDFERLMEH